MYIEYGEGWVRRAGLGVRVNPNPTTSIITEQSYGETQLRCYDKLYLTRYNTIADFC